MGWFEIRLMDTVARPRVLVMSDPPGGYAVVLRPDDTDVVASLQLSENPDAPVPWPYPTCTVTTEFLTHTLSCMDLNSFEASW